MGVSHKCRCFGDMCKSPGHGIHMLGTLKYPYLDCSNVSEQEFYYIPKDDIFLGHPVCKRVS